MVRWYLDDDDDYDDYGDDEEEEDDVLKPEIASKNRSRCWMGSC